MTHGHTKRLSGGRVFKSPTYHSWAAANDRCYIESHRWYPAYGGRGIEVCQEWRRSTAPGGTRGGFARFLAYLTSSGIGERPSKDMTLDRLRVNENYEPGNIGWATKSEQRANQRRNQENTDEFCSVS